MWWLLLRTAVLAAFLSITVAGIAGELRIRRWGPVWILDRPMTMGELLARIGSFPETAYQNQQQHDDYRDPIRRYDVLDPGWRIGPAAR